MENFKEVGISLEDMLFADFCVGLDDLKEPLEGCDQSTLNRIADALEIASKELRKSS